MNTISLKRLLEKDPNVSFAFIFGSFAKAKQKERSDLDIAIYFERPPEGLNILHFINKLSNVTGKEVDLIILNNASAFLRHQVMKSKISLVLKDSQIYRQFREKTISDYDEYKFISGINVYD